MDSAPKSEACCLLCDIKTGAVLTLGIELGYGIYTLVDYMNSWAFRHEGKMVDSDIEIFGWAILGFIITILGLYSITKKKPSLLIPCLILKTIVSISLLMIVILFFPLIGFIFIGQADTFHLVTFLIVYPIWIIYSNVVIYLCYKDMKADSNINGPLLSPSNTPYSHFSNQAV